MKNAKLSDAAKNVIDNVLMKKIGLMAIAIIRRRTLKGEFLPGSSEGAQQYSTKPFVMPLMRAGRQVANKFLKDKSGESEIFTAKSSGNLWVWVSGGYKHVRELAGRGASHVDLNWSGKMMRNLGIINTTNTTSTLGFPLKEADEIAGYHNIDGAGKSKRKHVFMGLTEAEKKEIVDFAGPEILKKLVFELNKHSF